MNAWKEALVTTLCFVVLLAVLGYCTACKHPQTEPAVIEARAKNAIDLAAYGQALAECRLSAKDAGAIAVYDACEKAADAKYGVKP